MQAEQSILDRIQRRQLKWYGHLLRMEDSRWPKKIYQWTPHGRRRRGRPQQSSRNQVTDFMKSRNMEEDMAQLINIIINSQLRYALWRGCGRIQDTLLMVCQY